jgi:hypothetical protein
MLDEKPVPESKWIVKPGERYNLLTILSPPKYAPPYKNSNHRVQRVYVKCDCGNIVELDCFKITKQNRISCSKGCIAKRKLIPKRCGTYLENGIKQCSACKKYKKEEEFTKHKKCRDGLSDECRECKHYRKILENYGLDKVTYLKLLKKHNYRCSICGTTESKQINRNCLNIDHHHTTNVIRGFLCGSCNRALGLFQDNIQILKNAMKYLKKYQKSPKEGLTFTNGVV